MFLSCLCPIPPERHRRLVPQNFSIVDGYVVEATTTTVVAKRGRGCPPKEVGESSNAPAKRGRGRPPKLGRGGGGVGRGRGRGHIVGGDAAVATVEGNRGPSPARSESPVGGFWDEFPISEFILTLYEPIQRIQWLPRAVADALEGGGPFRFLLHRVGARQGDRKSTRLNSSHSGESRMPSSA